MKKEKKKNKKAEKKKTFFGVLAKIVKLIVLAALIVGAAAAITLVVIDLTVKGASKGRILTEEEAAELEDVDCILVLGCGIKKGEPSPMLNDRIMQGVSLYKLGVSDTLLMSGDSRKKSHDETGVMKRVAIENGVNEYAILQDGYGLSTYDSMFRAAKHFGCKKIVIVTQKYHLYRAIYIARHYGIEAYGVNSDPRAYAGQTYREVREFAARIKDFLFCLIEPDAEHGIETWEGF